MPAGDSSPTAEFDAELRLVGRHAAIDDIPRHDLQTHPADIGMHRLAAHAAVDQHRRADLVGPQAAQVGAAA